MVRLPTRFILLHLPLLTGLLICSGCPISGEFPDWDSDGDGYNDAGDCDPNDASVFPGAVEICEDAVDNDCDGATDVVDDQCPDEDGDGYAAASAGGSDCDDLDASVNPGQSEVTCDAVDNDCDSTSLDDPDADADGVSLCSGDCDDGNASVYPGAAELCDNLDNDCDEHVDEYTDSDDDGDGYTECDDDCDDSDDRVYPGAYERCDGSDSDCDGSLPEDELDADGDGWIVCAGDCDDADDHVSPGATEICDDIDSDCNGAVDDECVECSVWVPADAASVSDALAVTGDGGVVCVSPGTYVENIDLPCGGVSLVGVAGAALTIFDGNGADSVIRLAACPGQTTRIEGFTVTHGDASSGGGVYVQDATVTLADMTFEFNTATHNGAAVYLDAATATLERLGVYDNTSTGVSSGDTGGGICAQHSVVTADSLDLRGNQAMSGGGFGAYLSDVTMTGVHLVDNTATLDGGGFHSDECSVYVSQVVATGNSAGTGEGGAMHIYASEGELTHLLLVDNHAARRAGGLSVVESPDRVDVAHARIAANTADSGSGLRFELSQVVGHHLSLVGNEAIAGASFSWGAGIFAEECTLDLSDLVAVNNLSNNCGGVIIKFSDYDLRYSDAWGNTPVDYGDMDDPTGTNGNLSVDPVLLDVTSFRPMSWDHHLSATSPLIDAGDPVLFDPDGSRGDMGAYGGDGGRLWDLDGDGFPEWWQPGPYDPVTYPGLDLDCDDLDPYRYPGRGC